MVTPARKPRERRSKEEPKQIRAKIDNNLRLKTIVPATEAQRMVVSGFANNQHIIAVGSAGSGKSFIATYLALQKLFSRETNKIVIVRSAVPTRSLGALPGTLDEKQEIYTVPYKQIVNDLCENGTAWDTLTKKSMIEFITTSYVRGITLDNCIVIVDEIQNMTWEQELYSILTRVGENCQVILCGDERQTDLDQRREKSGIGELLRVASRLPKWFEIVHHFPQDIVRSGFVRDLILAIE